MKLRLKKNQPNQPNQPNNGYQLEPFRWLFIAEFQDGHRIEQTQEDKSLTRTDGTGSRFSDVLAYPSRLVAFHLYNVNGKEAATVDLITGAFIVNGTPIHIHDQLFDPTDYDLELIYFRETRIERDQRGTVQGDLSLKIEDNLNPRHYVNRYFIGWQTGVGPRNYKVTLAVG